MPEYIEREALLKDIEEERPENWTDSEAERQAENDFYKYRGIVEIQPTADVVEVKHSEVIVKDHDEWWGAVYECGICGGEWMLGSKAKAICCPYCYAKMDLKEGVDDAT